jgi:hypothetical protein
MPDMSFDLDGDGYVGNKDFVLSKIFDKDNDGKLNEQERKNADEALKAVSFYFRKCNCNVLFRALKINYSGTLNNLV